MEENPPGSPPLPKKGAYSIDFDNLDQFANPFESKSKVVMGSSPPITTNNNNFDETVDPFKSSSKALANSPPSSPRSPLRSDHHDNDNDNAHTLSEFESAEDSMTSPEPLPEKEASPKKKKVIKKPVQSKFKRPKNFNKNAGDIEIIMPPGPDTDREACNMNTNGNMNEAESLDISNNSGSSNDFPLPPPPASVLQDTSPFQVEKPLSDRPSSNQDIDPTCSNSNDDVKDAVDFVNPRKSPSSTVDKPSSENFSSSLTPVDELHKNSCNDTVDFTPSELRASDRTVIEKHPALRALQSSQEKNTGTFKMSGDSTEKNETANNDGKGTVVQVVQVLRYSQTDWNKLKQELELNFQTTLVNKEREWGRLLADKEKKVGSLEDANKKLKSTKDDMRAVVTEFEKTMAQLQGEKEKLKSESTSQVRELESERDQALEDLASVENAFSDLHRRYEKSKTVIEGFKRNEGELKEYVDDLKQKLKKSESKLMALRSQAEEKLDKANEDIERIKKSTMSDVARLEAALKKSEVRISSLDEALARKEKENQELTAICDELIAKVGS